MAKKQLVNLTDEDYKAFQKMQEEAEKPTIPNLSEQQQVELGKELFAVTCSLQQDDYAEFTRKLISARHKFIVILWGVCFVVFGAILFMTGMNGARFQVLRNVGGVLMIALGIAFMGYFFLIMPNRLASRYLKEEQERVGRGRIPERTIAFHELGIRTSNNSGSSNHYLYNVIDRVVETPHLCVLEIGRAKGYIMRRDAFTPDEYSKAKDLVLAGVKEYKELQRQNRK